MLRKKSITIPTLLILFLAACTQDPADIGLGRQCSTGLDAGYRELNQAKADGFGGALQWTQAASLLSAAKIQQQFNEFQNCTIKVNKARGVLRAMRAG